MYRIKEADHFNDYTLSMLSSEEMYRKFRIIEGCDYDIISTIDSYHTSNNNKKSQTKSNGIFVDEIDSNTGLPVGIKWKFKCPAVGIQLQEREYGRYYCSVCKKDVFEVEYAEELQYRISKGECVRLLIKEESYEFARLGGFS